MRSLGLTEQPAPDWLEILAQPESGASPRRLSSQESPGSHTTSNEVGHLKSVLDFLSYLGYGPAGRSGGERAGDVLPM